MYELPNTTEIHRFLNERGLTAKFIAWYDFPIVVKLHPMEVKMMIQLKLPYRKCD